MASHAPLSEAVMWVFSSLPFSAKCLLFIQEYVISCSLQIKILLTWGKMTFL